MERPLRERIEEAFEWANKTLAQEPNAFSYRRLGETCYELFENQLAIEYYKKAISLERNSWPSLAGLARSYRALKDKELVADTASKQACDIMTESIRQAQALRRANHLDEGDRLEMVRMLQELADWYTEDNRNLEALPLYKQIVNENQEDEQAKWELLRLLCSTNQVEDATSLMKTWSKAGSKDGQKFSGAILSRMKYEENFYNLESLVQSVADHGIRILMIEAVNEAITVADRKTSNNVRSHLLYIQGLLMAEDEFAIQEETALQLWRQAFTLVGNNEASIQSYDSMYRRINLARYIFRAEFDAVRSLWILETAKSPETVRRIVRNFERRIRSSLEFSATPDSARKIHVQAHLASFYAMVGEKEKSRSMVRADMADALDILSDDDPENDWLGFLILMQALTHSGDIVGALSVFSLFDRKQSLGAQTGFVNGELEVKEVAGENCLAFSRGCDMCSKALSSFNPDGIWWCCYCPDVDYCADCFVKLRNGHAKRRYCNPNHEFIHLCHTSHDDDDVSPNQIRIDWEMERDSSVEGKFMRKGGRVVDIKDWLEMLRKDWNLPEPTTQTVAQK